MRTSTHAATNDDGDNDIKDDDEDALNENEWMSKKQRKLAMKRQRKIKWNKRREMMSVYDSEEENPDDTQTSQDEGNPMVIRRRWQSGKSKKHERRQKWRTSKKMKKRHHKNHGNRPSCFCLQAEQLEKLRDLIKKDGLEEDFPQIAPREENPADDNSSDVSEEDDGEDMTEETEDVNDGDNFIINR